MIDKINKILNYLDKHDLYPDMRVIQGGAEPEVIIDGKRVLMFSSNKIGYVYHDDFTYFFSIGVFIFLTSENPLLVESTLDYGTPDFTKIKNKFSDKDFELNRSAYFKNIWSTAQRSWREGHAYSDMDIKEKIYEQERRQRQSQLYFWY